MIITFPTSLNHQSLVALQVRSSFWLRAKIHSHTHYYPHTKLILMLVTGLHLALEYVTPSTLTLKFAISKCSGRRTICVKHSLVVLLIPATHELVIARPASIVTGETSSRG